jgi:hypothetical protein
MRFSFGWPFASAFVFAVTHRQGSQQLLSTLLVSQTRGFASTQFNCFTKLNPPQFGDGNFRLARVLSQKLSWVIPAKAQRGARPTTLPGRCGGTSKLLT